MTLPVVTTADADSYFVLTPRSSAWLAIADKDIWLTEAQAWLNGLCFDQDQDCCGRLFGAAWLQAVSELALALQQNPTAIIGSGSGGPAIKSAQLGGLAVEYFEGGSQKVSGSAPAVLQAFPWLTDILGCWLTSATGTSRIVARVRS